MNKYGYILLLLLPALTLCAQDAHKELRKGDRHYRDSEFETAEQYYRDAAKEKDKGLYNLGNSLYKQERFEESVKQYEEVLQDPAASRELKNDALFNLGNAYYELQDYQKSVDSYREYLHSRPEDKEARDNLWKAWQRMIKQQQQQQQQQQKGEQDRQPPPQKQASPQPPGKEGEEGQAPSPADQLRDDEAEQLLDIVEREDERVREELKERSAPQKQPKKDW